MKTLLAIAFACGGSPAQADERSHVPPAVDQLLARPQPGEVQHALDHFRRRRHIGHLRLAPVLDGKRRPGPGLPAAAPAGDPLMPRSHGLDRPLLTVVAGLVLFGLVVLYSAGQTDVPNFAARGAWERQLVWLGIGAVVAAIAFRFSPRLLEWASLPVYITALFLLALTLVVGRGAGTAASSKSWIYIGGHAIGQPAEFAKLAVALMLARHLSGLREAPETLRELIPACLIAGVPALLVLAQPDLGSALVFAGILFAMLFWAGVHPMLLLLLASPIASLLLAFNWVSWVGWMALLMVGLIAWRPYFWEGVAVFAANSAMGFIALPIWRKLEPVCPGLHRVTVYRDSNGEACSYFGNEAALDQTQSAYSPRARAA